MILSDGGIKLALKKKRLVIDPIPDEDQFTTSAVDLMLGDISTFQFWDPSKFNVGGAKIDLDLSLQEYISTAAAYMIDADSLKNNDGSISLPPYSKGGPLLLCQTRERVMFPHKGKLAARVEGKSSLARLGLIVHLTAPTIHCGFGKTITLEMINHGPFHLRLVPNKTPICQLIIEQLDAEPSKPINTKFVNQTKPSGK